VRRQVLQSHIESGAQDLTPVFLRAPGSVFCSPSAEDSLHRADSVCRTRERQPALTPEASRSSWKAAAGSVASVSTYRVHDHAGDDLGLVEHPAPNVEPGDVVVLADSREALVTARVEAEPGPLAGLLEVVVMPGLLRGLL
jgi:hypothetical protein